MSKKQQRNASTQPKLSNIESLSLQLEMREGISVYIAGITLELFTMAKDNEFGTLAYFLNLARIEAEKISIKTKQDR